MGDDTGGAAGGDSAGLKNQMAEGAPLKALADLMLLGDEYDRRARYAPAAIAVAPLAVAAFALDPARIDWLISLGLASFVQITMTSLYAHIGRATGANDERWLTNHGEMPMQRWLCPHNREHSKSQSDVWRAAVSKLVHLDYGDTQQGCEEYRRLGRDAFHDLQVALRVDDAAGDKPARPIYRIQQEEYGFSRNLTGMLGMWLISLFVGVSFTLYQAVMAGGSYVLVIIEMLFLACWVMVFAMRREFVMTGAERLSASLLSEAAARHDALKKAEPKAGPAPVHRWRDLLFETVKKALEGAGGRAGTAAKPASTPSASGGRAPCKDCGLYWSDALTSEREPDPATAADG